MAPGQQSTDRHACDAGAHQHNERLNAGAAASEVVAGEMGDAVGERGAGDEVCERLCSGVIEPVLR